MRVLARLTVLSCLSLAVGCGGSGPDKPVIDKNVDQKKSFGDTTQSGKKKEYPTKY